MNIETEEALYEQVANEIQAGDIKQGLWLKANVEADGSEQKAKSIYAKLRVSQLIRDYEAQEAEAAREIENQKIKEHEELIKLLKSKKCSIGDAKGGGYILYEPDGGCKPFSDIGQLQDYVQNKW